MPPSTTMFGSSIVKYGVAYAARRNGPTRSGSIPGSSSPAAAPSPMPDRITISTATAPTKRPPRYSKRRIGAVKKNASVRYSKSCCTARPITAAITVSAAMPRNDTVCATANGELIQTLPLPNEMIAPEITPPAAATHSIASAKKIAK